MESGCGKGQFYHYFADKDDLAAAVLEHQLGVVLGELEQFRLDTWTGIRAWFDALLSGQEQRGFRGCPVGSLAIELSAAGPDMQRRTCRFLRTAGSSSSRCLRRVGEVQPPRYSSAPGAIVRRSKVMASASRPLANISLVLGETTVPSAKGTVFSTRRQARLLGADHYA